MAHGSAVNCLAMGHKSGRVMMTVGDDKKVNMWAVGKPDCTMVSKCSFLDPGVHCHKGLKGFYCQKGLKGFY